MACTCIDNTNEQWKHWCQHESIEVQLSTANKYGTPAQRMYGQSIYERDFQQHASPVPSRHEYSAKRQAIGFLGEGGLQHTSLRLGKSSVLLLNSIDKIHITAWLVPAASQDT